MLQLCVCLRDREATDTRIDWARCSALRKALTPMKCPIHRNSWWDQLLSILQILQWYCMMSRWTVVLLINFRIAYHIMSVTVLGWQNGHGPMISYPMIIMIISHPFPPHHPFPRKVINLGELDSQRVVDGLQKISQFLDSYEKERSAELLEGVLDLLSPWLLIVQEILYLGNLYESIGNTEYVLLFWGFLRQIQANTWPKAISSWDMDWTFDLEVSCHHCVLQPDEVAVASHTQPQDCQNCALTTWAACWKPLTSCSMIGSWQCIRKILWRDRRGLSVVASQQPMVDVAAAVAARRVRRDPRSSRLDVDMGSESRISRQVI